MLRAEKKDSFVDFCTYAHIQIESTINYLFRHQPQDIQKFAQSHSTFSSNKYKNHFKNILRVKSFYSFWLMTEYTKEKLVSGKWLNENEKYWYHDFANPYSNNYCLVNNLREIRNLKIHPGTQNPIECLKVSIREENQKISNVNTNESDKLEKPEGSFYRIKTFEQSIEMFEDKRYDIIKETIYKFLEIILKE